MHRNPAIENSRGSQSGTRVIATPMPVNCRSALEIPRVAGNYERPSAEAENETTSEPDTSNRLDWMMVVIWLFVAICFGALGASLYIIWSKCGGNSPFLPTHLGAITQFQQVHL